jgi:uncharacterized protein (TIGR02757 family)
MKMEKQLFMLAQNNKPKCSKQFLDNIYKQYNRRELVTPDPLQFLYDYENINDREIAGLIASTLAYGRVKQILKSISIILEKLGPSPSLFLKKHSPGDIKRAFRFFKHRFTTGDDISLLFAGIKSIINKYGSLYVCFKSGINIGDHTVIPALKIFVDHFRNNKCLNEGYLLPSPERGSACKRLNLYLRWMIRKDEVDPGGWDKIPSSMLVIPLDTHMYKIGYELGFTSRKQADLKAALEITEGFRNFSPEDPVRYDFALTRFGIRDDLQIGHLLDRINSY